ncbi:MAG: serine hydrolase [Ignavibacteriae bacterium]|nr:serine hydrolase [Ignavibacteriota bacterium]
MNNRLFHFILSISLLLTIVFAISSCSSKIDKTFNFSEVNELMEQAISDSVFPGAVLLFGIDNSFFYSKAFGHYTYDKTSNPITTNSIFDLASVSKVVATTSAAMILVDESKLNLDEKVISYLPEFNNNGKEIITIKNLLVHNSGLAAFKKYYDEFSTAEEVINDIMNLELIYEPGTKYVYSDLGMITLQKVIERISTKSLDKFLEEKLFQPLGMNLTMYSPSNEIKRNCVPTELDDFWRMRQLQGEVHDERAFMLNGVAGHAGLFSTAEDLSKFARMLLNNGKFNHNNFIKKETIEEWTTKQSDQSDRGLGWDTRSKESSSSGKYFSKNSFGHTGYTGTSIWVDKESKLFVILLSNRVHPTRANRKIIKFRPKIHDVIYESVVGK